MTEHHLIVGGYGFIGRHVAMRLARAGRRVSVIGRNRRGVFPPDLEHRIEHRATDIDTTPWDGLIEQVDVVHYYAWTSIPSSANADPAADLSRNVLPLLALLDALKRRGAGRVIFSSSGGTVYGRLNQVPVPETHPIAPITAYGTGKVAAEAYLGLYRTMHGIDCRIARIANAYGAGQDPGRGLGAVTTFTHQAMSGQPINIWGDGEMVRDYIHVGDVSAALVALAEARRTEQFIFNVGSGAGVTLNQVVHQLECTLGRRLQVVRSGGRAFDVPISVLAIERARTVLEWMPMLSLSEGVSRTVAELSGA